MGLRESRIINSVHPWFGARLKWMEDVARLYGGAQLLISGNRTREEQLELFRNRAGTTRPVAAPGCSQHQYGFAADASWLPLTAVTSKGKPFTYSQEDTNRIMSQAAAHASLTTIPSDPGHMQVYNGTVFRQWAVSAGLCNPNFTLSRIQALCGPEGDFITQDPLRGTVCHYKSAFVT